MTTDALVLVNALRTAREALDQLDASLEQGETGTAQAFARLIREQLDQVSATLEGAA